MRLGYFEASGAEVSNSTSDSRSLVLECCVAGFLVVKVVGGRSGDRVSLRLLEAGRAGASLSG